MEVSPLPLGGTSRHVSCQELFSFDQSHCYVESAWVPPTVGWMGVLADDLEMRVPFFSLHTCDDALEGVGPMVVVAESHPLIVSLDVLVEE